MLSMHVRCTRCLIVLVRWLHDDRTSVQYKYDHLMSYSTALLSQAWRRKYCGQCRQPLTRLNEHTSGGAFLGWHWKKVWRVKIEHFLAVLCIRVYIYIYIYIYIYVCGMVCVYMFLCLFVFIYASSPLRRMVRPKYQIFWYQYDLQAKACVLIE